MDWKHFYIWEPGRRHRDTRYLAEPEHFEAANLEDAIFQYAQGEYDNDKRLLDSDLVCVVESERPRYVSQSTEPDREVVVLSEEPEEVLVHIEEHARPDDV